MIAPTSRMNSEPIALHQEQLFNWVNSDSEVMRYFPAVLSAAETDAFMTRIVEHRARHG